MKRLLLLLVFGIWACPEPARAEANQFLDWLSRVFGIRSEYYKSATTVRGEEDKAWGNQLVTYDTHTKKEKILWKAEGLCSPATVGSSELAVIRRSAPGQIENKDAGLWLVSMKDGSAHLAVPGQSFLVILGSVDKNPRKILVVEQAGENGRKIEEIDLDTKNVTIRTDTPKGPPTLIEKVPKKDGFWESRYLYDAKRPKGPRQLYIQDTAVDEKQRQDSLFGPSTLIGGELLDKIDRFDPIWVNHDMVVYIRSAP